MSDIEWKEDSVCRAMMMQWKEYSNSKLISDHDTILPYDGIYDIKDFQINEITTGDFIPASELDTEEKYNEVVEVFGLFGFDRVKDSLSYSRLSVDATHYLASDDYGIDSVSNGMAFKSYCKGRQLTHSQIIAIGKLKRMMSERGKSGAVSGADLTAEKHKSAVDYLTECVEVQKQRGEQYDSTGTGERSFNAAAKAYNALTGGSLKGSDVCLILTCVKAVRQYSNPSRLHEDSLLDLVSYASLWAEELNKELK